MKNCSLTSHFDRRVVNSPPTNSACILRPLFNYEAPKMSGRWILLVILLLTAGAAHAAIDVHEFNNYFERPRYQSFTDEIRCPECQNQNLSGSASPIADAFLRELYAMIQDGRSYKDIVDFMVGLSGEYILCRPRLSPATIMLWVGPAV